jgi:hypothetical protein
MEHFGRVLSVIENHIGSSLSQDESSGVHTLHLSDTDWCSEDGGDVYIKKGREVNTYDTFNPGASTIHLVNPTTQAYPEGAQIEPWNPDSRTRWAEVHIEGTEYEDFAAPIIAHIPGHLVNVMPVGTRRGWKEKVLVRRDERWRLFIHELIGLHGDMVTWLYQTAEDISAQSGYFFTPPYDATMAYVRATLESEGTSDTHCSVYDVNGVAINNKDIIIKSGKRKSDWYKLGGDDGYFLEDVDEFYCWVDTIGTGVGGPVHFYIRVLPKGAA